jgi:squalene-associated FAD-dependent desaturase
VSKKVVIIGGGFAGLSAAVQLADRGYQVTVLERRRHLGGRAYSFIDPTTGDVVDNGQHLFMACYQHTIGFLNKIGCQDKLEFQQSPRVDFLDLDQAFSSFNCPPLPAPLHALGGLFRMKGITVADKLRALRIGSALRPGSNGTSGQTVAGWLDNLGQSPRIKERFWYPMAIATLNEDPKIASAEMMKKVLTVAFNGGRTSASIGLSRVGLSDLYTGDAVRFVESRAGTVRTSVEVRHLTLDGMRITSCQLKGGDSIEADYFVSCVTHEALLRMLPPQLKEGEFAPLAGLESSPIISINLWLDRRVVDHKFVGLLGTNIQWLFNKDLIFSTGRSQDHLAIVISAAHKYLGWTKAALVQMAVEELHRLVPASCDARIIHTRVIKERDATLSHTVASDDLRPAAATSIPNFFLAGDWTRTGLPATIESAVLSGEIATDLISRLP